MYESATPLARFYSPFVELNDTFVLQEFFVPREKFSAWISRAKPVYKLVENLPHIDLLNTTIRFTWPDSEEVKLAYSQSPKGSFAFVLYYRMYRSKQADTELEQAHKAFVALTLELGGTFYLPYRHHYSDQEMDKSYPQAEEFFKRKQYYDPTCMFTSQWYNRYGFRFWDESIPMSVPSSVPAAHDLQQLSPGGSVNKVSEHRSDSYKRLINDQKLRTQFRDGFLTKIFNIEDNSKLYNIICKAVWSPQNKGDDQLIFEHICDLLSSSGGGAITFAQKTYKQVMQLKQQKAELVRETASILGHLGRSDSLVGYVSIGDNGKMVQEFRKHIGLKGRTWIVNDSGTNDDAGAPEIMHVLERGSPSPVGEYVYADLYSTIDEFAGIPDSSCDLVTMNQGLHHLNQKQLPSFLAEVYRVLRPSGLFITREHNASPDLIPMLDLAHSVFNAVTGVSSRGERQETRAFRSILEWRVIIESAGFIDSMLYEMEDGDPTLDEMMCFIKPPFTHTVPISQRSIDKLDLQADEAHPPLSYVPTTVQLALDQGPLGLMDAIQSLLKVLSEGLPELKETITTLIASLASESQKAQAEAFVGPAIAMLATLLSKLREQFEQFDFKEGALAQALPLEEFALIALASLQRGDSGVASGAMELAAISALREMKAMYTTGGVETPEQQKQEDGGEFATPPSSPKPSGPSGTEPTVKELEKLLSRLIEARPELASSNLLTEAHFPPRAISLVLGKLGGADRSDMAQTLGGYLDAKAFEELSLALNDVIDGKRREPFTWEAVQNPESIWWEAMMAFLGSPKVKFSSAGKTMASFAGLGPLMEMYQVAQKARRSGMTRQTRERTFSVAAKISHHTEEQLTAALQAIDDNEKTLYYDFRTEQKKVLNLGGIKSARLIMQEGDEAHEADVTAAAREVLTATGYNGAPCLLFDEERGKTLIKGSSLPAPKRGYRYKPGDLLTGKYQFGGMTRGILGSLGDVARGEATPEAYYSLRVTYTVDVATEERNPGVILPRVQNLMERLKASNMVKDMHSMDGEWTWYKLNEWMQVEIFETFAAAMSTEPWFRFPFMDFLVMYWRVLFKEADIVAHKHGTKKAYASMAMVTSMVPGVFMAAMFSQMHLAAVPCKFLFGEDNYDENDDHPPLEEQIVLRTLTPGQKEPDWASVDPRIIDVVQVVPGLFTLMVPTFKPFTEVLKALAKVEGIQVLQISNQIEVQVRVEWHSAEQLDELKREPGCEVLFDYKFPVDKNASKDGVKCAALCVDIPYLLEVMRMCEGNDIKVMQVYDWYC